MHEIQVEREESEETEPSKDSLQLIRYDPLRHYLLEISKYEPLSQEEEQKLSRLFRDYHDKEWSFTDCTSFVVMERLGVTRAFAFDDHFRQFGKATILP